MEETSSGDSDYNSSFGGSSSDSKSNSGNDSDSSSDKNSSGEDEAGETITPNGTLVQDKGRVTPPKNLNFGESIRCGLELDKKQSTQQTSGVHLYLFNCLIDFDVV